MEKNYLVRIGFFPQPITVVMKGKDTQTGLSFAFTGKLIDGDKVKWKTGFNLLLPQMKLDQLAVNSGQLPNKSSYQAGLQNSIDYKAFFFRLNMLLDAGHTYYVYSNQPPFSIAEKHSDFSINYILLGYYPSFTKNSVLKNTSVFIQTRNLFMSKKLRQTFLYDNYAGVGVSIVL